MRKVVGVPEVVKKCTMVEYYCDICNTMYYHAYSPNSCVICGRDVCKSCSELDNIESDDEDYPDRICIKCRAMHEFYDRLSNAHEKFESEKEEIFRDWKNSSLKGGN